MSSGFNRNRTDRSGFNRTIVGLALLASGVWGADESRLPDGSQFQSWEKPLSFSKTYFVDQASPNAADDGPGSKDRPFRTVSKAADVLQPGERVVIAEGIYREAVHPRLGGSGPGKMIGYEAAPGAKVTIKGSVALKSGWKRSQGWVLDFYRRKNYGDPDPRNLTISGDPKIWEMRLDGALFGGYNPFGLINILHDRYFLDTKTIDMTPFLRRRGMLFVDGKPMQQVDLFRELGVADGTFWIESNGMKLHLRLPADDSPDKHLIEATTKEQVFAPEERGLGYIRVAGIAFEQAASGFPIPQRGLVSTNSGHHWIIEGNTIDWANSIGLDVGYQDWNAEPPPLLGHHIIRRNTVRNAGICGIAGLGAPDLLIEDNLIEHCGWQGAENAAESAAVKLHFARNLLFRRNVIRHITFAAGLWLDAGNVNCRVTRNVIADIKTRSAAIHIEASHEQNQIDNNIIWGVRQVDPGRKVFSVYEKVEPGRGGWGILNSGSDRLIVAQNLIMDTETSGFFVNPWAQRIILGRAGTARDSQLFNNIFGGYSEAAIYFAHEHNTADGNLYAGRTSGSLRILNPEPPQWLDLDAWREFHGWDLRGALAKIEGKLDVDALTLTLSVSGTAPEPPIYKGITIDFFGVVSKDTRAAGPFADLDKGFRNRSVDPRQRK